MTPRSVLPLLAVVCLALPTGCAKEHLIATVCRDDSACPDGQLCQDFECVPAAAKACDVVTDGTPVLQPSPYAITFGDLDVTTATQTLSLHNIGNCTLTLFEADLGLGDASPFGCALCTASFPMEIWPGRSKDFAVTFTQKAVGPVHDEIKILSDDKEFSELRVPLDANYLGAPKLNVTPNPIDFGYVPQGRSGSVAVTLSNLGSGVAPLTVTQVAFADPSTQNFEFAQPFTGPVTLKPVSIDSSAVVPLELRYTPRSTAIHTTELVVTTDHGEVRVPMTGNAQTPPKLSVNPLMLDLGSVPAGRTNLVNLTIGNSGGAPLTVSYAWGGPNPTTDLFATPAVVPAVAGGAYTQLQVGFTATSVGVVQGLLVLTTNDPNQPSLTIPVTARGTAGTGPEVVKVEMVFDNGTDGVFDNDVRNVDLTLEHPYGYVCNKTTPSPMNWAAFGTPTWLAFPPKEEPERIVLADATADGTYRVMVSYMEDCSSLPTQLLAGVLGISVDALISYLSGGVINVGSGDVSSLIASLCLSHDSSNVTVRTYINGTLKKEKTVSLGRKGDSTYVEDLVHVNGAFTVQ
jgi:hypothetical protein